MTHFIHCRYTTQINHAFGQTFEIDGRGGLTVAYTLDPEASELRIGYAKCSRRDLYNKKRGRAIAEGRLKSSHYSHRIKFDDPEAFNKLSLDRREAENYVFGAMTQILPEEALPDYYQMLTR